MANNQQEDQLDRAEFIKDIEPGIESIRKEGGVVAIHASFGMGKTFFCNVYSEHLNKEKEEKQPAACIIDASLHDYTEDPFIPINQAVYKLIGENQTLKKFKEATINLVRKFIPKIATTAAAILPPLVAEGLGDAVEEWLEPDSSLEKIKEEYIKALKELTQNKPLTIFIDELDRCKPDYALKFLERLKHYFNKVPNLLFVLMIDQEQIYSSIKHEYGAQEPHRYFEKFLSTSIINLPGEPSSSHTKYLDFRTRLIKGYNIHNITDQFLISAAALIFEITKCNYRTQEKILRIEPHPKSYGESQYFWPVHTLLLRALKESHPDIFNKLKNQDENGYPQVYELLLQGKGFNDGSVRYYIKMLENLYIALEYKNKDEAKAAFDEISKNSVLEHLSTSTRRSAPRNKTDEYDELYKEYRRHIQAQCKLIS